MNDARRRELGLPPAVSELFHVRERWASVANEALREAGIDARIDHRTLAAQGIDREPYPYLPHAAFQMERHGFLSVQGEKLRKEYQERVAARREREVGREHDVENSRDLSSDARHDVRREGGHDVSGDRQRKPPSLEEVRRQAREDWLKMREEMREQSRTGAERSRDDDLSL
jgi:hypothetical protein